MLRRSVATGLRCFSTGSTANALRKANHASLDQQTKTKLDRVARPFQSLLSPYTGTQRPSELTLPGHGLNAADLSKLEVPEDSPLRQLLSLAMSGQNELKHYHIHTAMGMFARRPNDTGSPEVQAAVWSVKIAALEAHCRQYRHDYVAERKIVEWRDQRRKILRYLKRVSLERYFDCLDRLGLPHDLVEAAMSRFPRMPLKKQLTYDAKQKAKTQQH